MQWVFKFLVIVFSMSKLPFDSSRYLLFLGWCFFVFPLISRMFALIYWTIFIIASTILVKSSQHWLLLIVFSQVSWDFPGSSRAEQFSVFPLADSWPSWVQITSSLQLPVGCGSNGSAIFKASAVLFGSVPCMHLPTANLGLRQWPVLRCSVL